MKSFPDVIELTQELVRIPSVNPAGTPGTNEVGEERVAQKVGEYLEAMGAKVEFREVLPCRPNVLGYFPNPAANGKQIVLAPHLDTVSVLGMKVDPFAAELRNDRIYGRGASDTKGPMAAMLSALYRTRELLPKLPYEIWFAGVMGEEAGNDGALALAEQMQPDFVIAGEPTGLQIVYKHKGTAWIELVTHGKSAHGSAPEMGENAIYKMSQVLDYLQTKVMPRLAAESVHPVLGPVTLNAGMIHGGSKVNIVPDTCRLELDCRFVPKYEQFPAKLCHELEQHFPGITAHIQRITGLLDTSPEDPLVRKLRDLGAPLTGAAWYCDAACFSRKGVPAVALGPGSIAQAHTEDEWIKVEDLQAGADFFVRFLESLGQRN